MLCQAVPGCGSAEWNFNDLKPSACQDPRGHGGGVGAERGAAVAAEGRPYQSLCPPTTTFPAVPYFGAAEGGRGRVSPRSAVAVATAVFLAAQHTFLAASPSVSC